MRALALLALVCVSCGDTIISAEDYSSSCTADDECTFAYFGDVCGACLTDFQAVNVSEIERINADRDAISCAPWSARFTTDCVVPVPQADPVCDDGRCVFPDP